MTFNQYGAPPQQPAAAPQPAQTQPATAPQPMGVPTQAPAMSPQPYTPPAGAPVAQPMAAPAMAPQPMAAPPQPYTPPAGAPVAQPPAGAPVAQPPAGLPASMPPQAAPQPMAAPAQPYAQPAVHAAPVASVPSIFDNLGSAKVFENSKYFQPGIYLAQIQAVKLIQQGYSGDSFVIECKIVAVQSQFPDAPQPGEVAAQVWRVSGDKLDIGRGTWMGFLCSMFGVAQNSYTDEQWKQVSTQVIDQNALAGAVAYLEVFQKPQKRDPSKMFTQHKWGGIATADHYAQLGFAPPA